MSVTSTPAPEREIVNNILEEAEARARALIETANATAAEETRKLREEGERTSREILEQAEQQALRERAKAAAAARIEAKRLLFQAREEAVESIMREIEKRLNAVQTESTRYRKSLLVLAVEAVKAIGEAEITLTVGKADAACLDEPFFSEVKGNFGNRSVMQLSRKTDDGLVGPGVRASSRNGRIVFDNTYHRRLERARASLRAQVVKEMLNCHE